MKPGFPDMRALVLVAAFLVVVFDCEFSRAAAATLEKTEAFERSYAASFYTFDACGDSKHGRLFRLALVDRFKQCPFSPAAQAVFKNRTAAQREKSAKMIAALIEETGGLPIRLEGMTLTCHEQQLLPDYLALREKLDRYGDGQSAPSDVLKAACDSEEISP